MQKKGKKVSKIHKGRNEIKTTESPVVSIVLEMAGTKYEGEGNTLSEALLKIPRLYVKGKGFLTIKTKDGERKEILSVMQMRRFFRGDEIRKKMLAKRLGFL